MDRDKILIFTDHVGRFYAERYGFPPVTGRLIGYLSVCDPMQQTINEIADALLTSRSAINSAVKQLEIQGLVNRTRPAGTRADLISFNPDGWKNTGFDPSEYTQTAVLLREGLELLQAHQSEQRQGLEIATSLNEFMAERLPQIYEEFMAYHQKKQNENKES
jgi:DNA-binding transcriptional regulator GbsR (MarR family)